MLPGDYIKLNIGDMPTKPFTEPNFENYRTFVFDREFMCKTIGTGDPMFDGPEFVGFDTRGHSERWPKLHTMLRLECRVWLGFVPEVYREDCERGLAEVGKRFINTKITPKTVPQFVDNMRRWIGENVEPK